MPDQRPQAIPFIRVAVEVVHGVPHARLDRLALVVEEPHDSAPRNGGKDRELARVGLDGACGHPGRGYRAACAWRGAVARKDGGNDARDDV